MSFRFERAGSQQAPRPLVSLGEGSSEGSERSSMVVKRVLATPTSTLASWMHLDRARWAGDGGVFSSGDNQR